MPSTYTLNNGIELIATGEQSGTWGDTTNTNLSLIDVSLDGQVSITLPSAGTSGSPNTLDIQDGTASNGRNRFIIFNDGGDLGSSAFVQLTPNDAEKIVYIRNNLSGSRSVLVFQGTYNASNDYEIPSGTTAIIYFNGAGAGAVAANVFNNAYFDSLRLGSVSVTAILDEDNMASDSATSLATQQSIKAYVDSQVGTVDTLAEILANGNTTGGTDIAVSAADDITFADNSKAIFGTGSDLQIYHNGANSYIDDTGTGNLYIRGSDTVRLQSATGEQGVIVTTDGAVTLYHDNGSKLATTATGIDVTGTVTADGLIVASDSTYAIDVSRPSAGNTTLRLTGGTTAGNDVVFRADIGNTTGTSAVYFGDTDTNGIGRIMYEHTGDYMRFYTSSTEKMRIDTSGNVGIGTSSPADPLDVVGTIKSNVSSTGDFNFRATSTGGGQYLIYPDDATTANPTWLHQTNSSEDQAFVIGGVERVRIDSAGNVGIGTSSPLVPLVTVGTSMATSQAFVGSVADTSYSGGIINLSNSSRSIGITSDPTNAGTSSLINFSVDGSERMRIDSAGNMLLGTTSSTTDLAYAPKLKLSGNGPAVYLEETDTSQSWSISALSSGFYIRDATASAIRLFINSSGNVGIGTNTPTSRLEVRDETDISMNATGTGHFEIAGNGYNFAIALNASGANLYTNSASRSLIFGTDETERMRIDGSGNVLLGKTASSDSTVGCEFQANGYATATASSSVNTFTTWNMYSTGAGAYRFYVGAGGTVYATSTSISAISDATLKENVRDLETGLTEVMALRPRRFDWKNGDAQDVAGFVAQEVEQVLPELVTDYVYNKDKDGNDIIKKSLKMGDILPTLVKAIQEQQAIITAQQAALESLTARVAALEGQP